MIFMMIRLILIFFLHVSVFVCAASSRSVTLKTKVVLANDRLAFNVTITNKMGKDIYVLLSMWSLYYYFIDKSNSNNNKDFWGVNSQYPINSSQVRISNEKKLLLSDVAMQSSPMYPYLETMPMFLKIKKNRRSLLCFSYLVGKDNSFLKGKKVIVRLPFVHKEQVDEMQTIWKKSSIMQCIVEKKYINLKTIDTLNNFSSNYDREYSSFSSYNYTNQKITDLERIKFKHIEKGWTKKESPIPFIK